MPTAPFETWDVFTDRRFQGNPLAVITDGAGLSGEQMQLVAREFNLSETTFVLPPENPAHDARVRIYMVGQELPFAGHPTVGTALSLAMARGSDADLTLELTAGLFPVAINRDGDRLSATFTNPNPPRRKSAGDAETAPSAAIVAASVGLAAAAIEGGDARPGVFGAGVDFIYAKSDMAGLAAARPDAAAICDFTRPGLDGLCLYAKSDQPDLDYQMRMFAPASGILEDPATGSAACALPGHVAASGALADGAYHWRVAQGVEMGRPSLIEVSFSVVDGVVGEVSVGGRAVRVQTGVIEI